MNDGWTKTTCPYCGVGCGVLVRPDASGAAAAIKGDPAHPANFGKLCSKGSALGETLGLDGRLLAPRINDRPATWDAALGLVADRFSQTIAAHGPDSVALYVSGQLLTEDYYVANKLMKGFIGTANIDTNSRLCMASSVAGHRRAFGTDTVPGCYEDLEEADLVVLVGSNLAWCHPVLFQRLEAARAQRGTRIVVIDPRETATASIADLHLALRPGSDVALFNGLLIDLVRSGGLDRGYIWRHTTGLLSALKAADGLQLAEIAVATGLTVEQLRTFYDLFARTPRTVTIYSQGVNQSVAGTDKVNAIINCHLLTGRIGKTGMGPFSVTGQPNAMGGREVGGLANMLAAHMNIEDPGHRGLVQEFWQSPSIAAKPGLKAVDMFRAAGDGRIKAIWIMGTNPAVSMPEADQVRAALERCPFVVVSDVNERTDTTAFAHVLLPSLAWGEKSGTVTNSERRISRQRAFLPPPGDAKPDWWQLADVARRMGFGAAFTYRSAHEIFVEHARLTAFRNEGARDLDLGGLGDVTAAGYDALAPLQWPATRAGASRPRFFADGQFYTADGRARFVPTPFVRTLREGVRNGELVLNTGRVRDQWHTMTRTGKVPRLMRHIGEPFVEMHPTDAAYVGVRAAELVEVTSSHGRMVARVQVTARQQRGSIFAPMHWTAQFASSSRVDVLVTAAVDPVSGQPGLKESIVSVRPFAAAWYGLVVSRERPDVEGCDYWASSPVAGGWRVELAGLSPHGDAGGLFERLCGGALSPNAERLSYGDPSGRRWRCAAFSGETLGAALFLASEPVEVSRAWAGDLLTSLHGDRLRVLAGRAGGASRDKGPIVCACFDVGRNEIADAISTGRCSTVEAVGVRVRAGTNCGSCRSEIGRLIDDLRITTIAQKAS